ncbi:MAG TPA: 2Fe-2S iron-sulfur cluster-binding protein [Burkholderiales bacterium]|nr:2Fe-2S iron-sulfur cluster-binding protein [Burkholderiales bacterium]
MTSRLRRIPQWLFLRTEALFNLAFGDRLNPLYYLGPISYYLMWLVVASGLYLYAFFETSVTGAYESVEAVTHGHFGAGGVVRSIHRYASDGVVLTMLLHMARHWAFDRYRGFRWFSWVSGVALLWLVYVSGINGYMLPWDRLSQFVVIATAEWLDWLPVFDGALARNFVLPENVSDRLFSLLSFIHIGAPLVVLALLWVHTQRVPQARTAPPLPIALTLTGALVALSLIHPALSQERADLAAAVTSVAYDWFYLPVYALLYRWTPGGVWLLVAGATALFLVLPWLPPAKKAAGHFMLARPENRIVPVRAGETLLDAGLREGLALPYECRNGGCGKCKVTLAYGEVDYGAYQSAALSADERAAGKVLACTATALGDLEIEYQPTRAPGGIPARLWSATVERLEPLAPDVMRVILKIEDKARLAFYAGQYINVLLEDGARRSFSFATAPQGATDRIELHIRRIAGGRFTTHVFEGMRPGERLRFEGPLGSFFLREDSDKPIIFVAGSTGFAPVKSMIEYAFSQGRKRRMLLYWGARSLKDLYLAELPEKWQRENASFTFVPVLSAPEPGDLWSGRTGLVHEAILADFPDLGGYQVYACGSAAMVEAAHPAFRARGLAEDDCFSDAFRLSPRPEMVKLGGTA